MAGETNADAPRAAPGDRTRSRLHGRISITVTLATAIGLLVLVSVGGVLGLGIWIAQKNTFSLLSANAHQAITANVTQLRQHLRPAAEQAGYIAERIMAGEIDPTNHVHFGPMLLGSLAAAPQIAAILYIDPALQAFSAGRGPEPGRVNTETVDYSNDPVVRSAMLEARRQTNWGPPTWSQLYKQTYLNHAVPLVRGESFLGVVASVVSVGELSRFVGMPDPETRGTRFILYGDDVVLAHSLLADGYPEGTDAEPLPRLAGFGDPILAAIWNQEDRYDLIAALEAGTEGHVVRLDGEDYLFFYQRVAGFGPKPLIAGAYVRAANVSAEVERMVMALIAGLGALALSLVAAVIIGRRIAKPIVRFSGAAARIRDLEIAKIEDLPGSVFRELNEQANAFNAMLRALRWFEIYVPRKIVERLVRRGALSESSSDARDVTVLFSDIVGFSSLCEGLGAPEVAAFVNHHFSLVAACIEAEDGTVDKFMGDAVMAFWGAPDDQPDAAQRACRAALAMAERLRADNAERVARSEKPVHVRIGIHSGGATVGNIGAPGRLNYTIIGDTVNIGERLEQLGKEVYPPGTDVSILISGDTARQLGEGFVPAPIPTGLHRLKGRAGEIAVFRLER